MPIYSVLVTRDITESCVVTVSAVDEDEAGELALDHMLSGRKPEVVWEIDDGSVGTSPAYVTGVEENK